MIHGYMTPSRAVHTITFDSKNGVVVLFGGYRTSHADELNEHGYMTLVPTHGENKIGYMTLVPTHGENKIQK